LEFADRGNYPYLAADHSILADPDLSQFEKAKLLQRTYDGTCSAIHRFGYTSRHGRGDPSGSEWFIDAPNAQSLAVVA